MATDPAAVAPPKHPLYALTTSELSAHRRQLESAIAYCDSLDSVPRARGDLQARLDDVIAEQDDRTKLAVHA
jgi:hypothetical protein